MYVDHSAIKVNQAGLIALIILAYLLNLPALVALTAIILALGTVSPALAFFGQLYRHVLKPARLVKPHVVRDNPAPHRFAQALGATFLTFSALVLLVMKASLIGWALAALVAVLAAINLLFGFCAGCFLYYQIARLRHLNDGQRST
ncbi:MAG: DUF4395 domain-containing protein [Ardenticatenaceae bacterium]|nr:DUF4395 domain-containing protein [Ardenticatenaceae bacterium]HBY97949.1 DUF4395 domain-containing protein [Chloroflexota bacterium]